MKKILLIGLCFLSVYHSYAQILQHDEDVNDEAFTFESLDALDARMATQFAERKLKTLLTGIANKALATTPFIGSSGVQQELLGTNVKFDELITLNKNYNYKLTACLGNILKLTKEVNDGTLTGRAQNLMMKAKVIKQSVDVITKAEKLKKAYERLSENGWNNNDLIRGVVLLDGLMKKAEELSKTLIDAWKSSDYRQQQKRLEEVQEKLKALDNYLSNEVVEIQSVVDDIYTEKLNNKISRSYFEGIYNYKYTQEEARAKYQTTISDSKNNLIAFRNFYWLIVSIIAFVAAIGYVFKLYTTRENIISSQMVYWILTLAIVAFLGTILEFIKI